MVSYLKKYQSGIENSLMAELQYLTEKFVTFVLGSEQPKGNCFGVCFALSLYLKNNGIENSMKCGFVNNTEGHYILALKDNEEIIIDPTIQQFDINRPQVFIGKMPDDYEKFIAFDFNGVYQFWTETLLNYGYQLDFEGKSQQVADIRALLRIHLKAATILNNERNQSDNFKKTNYEQYNMYFEVVYNMVMIYKDEKEQLVDPLLFNEFDKLLNMAEKATQV